MSIAVLVLRLVVGLLFIGHGAEKLRDCLASLRSEKRARGAVAFFEEVGLTPALPLAAVAGMAELSGGFLLASGLVTPLGTALIAAVMCTAIATVHWRKGLWNAVGGFEFPLVMLTAAFTITALGPGDLSINGWAGLDDWLTIWSYRPAVMAGAAVGAGAVAAALALGLAHYRKTAGRRRIKPITPTPA